MMRIDIFSDTVCPWCYLGKRRFELALAARPQYEPRIMWRPFELNPELPLEGVDRRDYLRARVGDAQKIAGMETELTRLGEAIGIGFRFDLIRRVPNTRRSHLMIAHAARIGRAGEIKDRIMKGYFEEGVDIGDAEELTRLGVDCGLEQGALRNALILRAGQDGVVAAERHAAVLGISGVPTFIFEGQYTISGAQEVGTLAQIFDQVAEMTSAREAAT
jgi:predicted DsbA family dithiol-disulfide isomerase